MTQGSDLAQYFIHLKTMPEGKPDQFFPADPRIGFPEKGFVLFLQQILQGFRIKDFINSVKCLTDN